MPKYISWIPTNLGLLRHEFIDVEFGKEKEEEIDYSDTVTGRERSEELTFKFRYKFEAYNFNGGLLKFEIKAYPQDALDEESWLFKVEDGVVYKNGKMVFECIYNNRLLSKDSDITNVPNTILTFVKRKIHTDIHHKEKVDNIIPVITTEQESVWKNCIIEKLALHIKQLEHDAKRIYHNQNRFERFSKIREIYLDALGVEAYRKSFINLFFSPGYSKALNTDNVLESLKVMSEKVEKERSKYVVYAGLFTTFVTLFISISIVLQNHFGLSDKQATFKAMVTLFLVWVVVDILSHLYFGKTLLLLPTTMKAKELYQRIYIAGHNSFNKLQVKYKLLYLFLKFGEYIFFIIAISMIILWFMEMYKIK